MSASAADPRKLLGAGCDKWGAERLALAVIVKDWLDKAQHSWFIESGTLLGAWRSGSFIAHDDDFDIALVIVNEDVAGELRCQCDLLAAALPAPYECRVTASYCDKIEVFDPTQGDYALLGDQYQGARFHYVTIDLQAYVPRPFEEGDAQSGQKLVPRYRACPEGHAVVPVYDDCLPVGSCTLEGQVFPTPHDTEAFLRTMYGYLGKGARFDPVTGKYAQLRHARSLPTSMPAHANPRDRHVARAGTCRRSTHRQGMHDLERRSKATAGIGFYI